MAKRRSWLPAWCSHRNLISVEVVLLVGAANQAFGDWITHRPEVANWGKALFTMLGVIGAFGVLFALVSRAATAGVAGTHKAIQALPMPTPFLLVHLAALGGIFLLYAWLWGFWPVW
ncbi:MAG: hypothetical protein RLZZ127_1649 [Planctomycetota bacterium]|jgi:hypothetical protein